MKKITLSINPTYLCNFRCNFCYLTPEELGDKNKLDLDVLAMRVKEIQASGFSINHVDLYGGEIALLKNEYLETMDQILLDNGDPSLNIITNLSVKHPFFLNDHIDLSVSYDFDVREKNELVLTNIITTNKNIAILMLATRQLIDKDIQEMVQLFNSIKNIVSVEIKPYSPNQANQQCVSDTEFEEFVKKWIDLDVVKDFEFVNEEQIKQSLNKKRNAFSNDHVYITPSGKYAVLEFDDDNNEYFLELDTFKQYIDWSEAESKKVRKNVICNKCEYLGHCLTEHYREVTDLNSSCNGYKGLLDYYKKSDVLNKVGTL